MFLIVAMFRLSRVLGLCVQVGLWKVPGCDVILDLVGAGNFEKNIDALAVGGRLLLVGLPSGTKATINLAKVLHLPSQPVLLAVSPPTSKDVFPSRPSRTPNAEHVVGSYAWCQQIARKKRWTMLADGAGVDQASADHRQHVASAAQG